MSDEVTPSVRPTVGKIRTEQEHADLLTFHIAKLREARAVVDGAHAALEPPKAQLKIARDELARRFSEARNDLGRDYTRDYIEGVLIRDGDAKIRDLVSFERRRATDKVTLNQPVYGVQPELFPGEETPTAARDEMAWEAEGYLRGRRADMDELQDGDPPEFHQAIMRGYAEGQKRTAEGVQRAMEAKAAAGPDPDQAPVNLNPDDAPEVTSLDAKRAERKSIERAKESLGVPANKVPV